MRRSIFFAVFIPLIAPQNDGELLFLNSIKNIFWALNPFFILTNQPFLNLILDSCGPVFPFEQDSDGSKSIIEYLHSNLNYKTRITSDGKIHIRI